MDNINNAQTSAKTFLKGVSMISAIAMVLSIMFSNAYADPPERVESCESEHNDGMYMCCWTEIDPTDPEQIEIYKCQSCILENNVIDCTPVKPDLSPSPTREEDMSPGDSGVMEQPPSQNEPPIKSDESLFPNDDSEVSDEQQPTNPTFNSNKGTIIDKNLAEDQPMHFFSNNEENQELVETNDADTTSSNQENDDLSTSETTDSEMTTNFAKKGNAQNSPVPPECPNQGPIPPDCTMKPKF